MSAGLNRRILALAVPALGALVAEPLFLIVDSALVGHLGIEHLAGLGIASAVLQTIVGLMVFLAYATTPAVARWLGAGEPARAVSVGIDGMWLALAVGIVLAVGGWLATPTLVAAFGPSAAVGELASTYLAISMAGLPAMLVVFAATGLLRGMQDTVTPLWIAGVGFTANALLNGALIYGLGLGIAGSAIGTVAAQWLMVAAYVVVIGRLARRHSAALRPSREGMRSTGRAGGWLLLRTLSLRVALLLTVAVASGLGATELAGYQVVFVLFSTAAFALDALAIAAQALIGRALGAGQLDEVRMILRVVLVWGAGFGVIVGGVIAALAGVIGLLFTGDAELAAVIHPALLVLAVAQPIAGLVFVLDGVLIGAGDVRYLALTGILNLAALLPLLAAVTLTGVDGVEGLTWLSAAFFGGYLLARLVTLGLRARGTAWVVTGTG